MGQFSWLDCITEEQIYDDEIADVYVLVPKEYGGGHILETCYDGYGRFGGHDIFDLVADWNKPYLSEKMLRKKPSSKNEYGGLYICEIQKLKEQGLSKEEINQKDDEAREEYYQRALKRYQVSVQKLEDFKTHDDEWMEETYGKDFKRTIGIDIACYDKQNEKLPFPIKITHNENAVYENCSYSLSDPNQGWRY